MDENELTKKYNNIYLSIIMRYRDYIEEHEGVYVTELPKLVTPSESSVQAAASAISAGIPGYSSDQDFLQAARLAQQYVKDKIATLSLPIQFWQRPSETLANGAGDPFDKAVLLCSILIALGGVSTKVIISASENRRDFLVYSEYRGEFIVADMENGVSTVKSKDEVLSYLKIDSETESVYEFNDKMYSNIE